MSKRLSPAGKRRARRTRALLHWRRYVSRAIRRIAEPACPRCGRCEYFDCARSCWDGGVHARYWRMPFVSNAAEGRVEGRPQEDEGVPLAKAPGGPSTSRVPVPDALRREGGA